MKLFTSFFVIYLIFLAMVPCGDKLDCDKDTQQEIFLADSENHSEKPHTEEACTPFCSCSCCSISMVSTGMPIPFSVYVQEIDQTINFADPSLLDTHLSVWQPPQIG